MRDELTKFQIARIGAIGGICLSILKLIEVKFYVGAESSNEIIVGYLTYVSYVLLGMAVAVYFSDRELPAQKLEKNALMMGLLAPSILIAIITKPVQFESPEDASSIIIPEINFGLMQPGEESSSDSSDTSGFNLGGLILSSAHAQESNGQIEPRPDDSAASKLTVKTITKSQFEPTLSDHFLGNFGRAKPLNKYFFVIGVAETEENAEKFAESLNNSLECKNLSAKTECAQLVKPEGGEKVFVTYGDYSSAESAALRRDEMIKHTLNASIETSDFSKLKSVQQLSQGQVLPAAKLFEYAAKY